MIPIKQNNDSLLQENELYTIGLSDGREHQRVKYLGNKLLNGKPMMVFYHYIILDLTLDQGSVLWTLGEFEILPSS